MKGFATLFLAAALATGVAACGSDYGSSSDSSTPATQSTGGTPEQQAEQAADGDDNNVKPGPGGSTLNGSESGGVKPGY